MKKYIDKLHERPVHQKREVAAHAAAVVTGLIFLIWFSTLSIRFLSGTQTTTADSGAATLVAATAAANEVFQTHMRDVEPAISAVSGTAPLSEAEVEYQPDAPPAVIIGAPIDQ